MQLLIIRHVVALPLLLLLLCLSHSHGTGVCQDTVVNCEDYDPKICHRYPRWAAKNCAKTCEACQACPDGWSYYKQEKTCVRAYGAGGASGPNASWWEARKNCQAHGGDLVVLRSEGLTHFLLGLMGAGFEYWIGLINVAREGFIFMYVDQTNLGDDDFHPWVTDNPDDYEKKEKCVCIYPRGVFTGRWNDFRCQFQQPYICQRKPDTDV